MLEITARQVQQRVLEETGVTLEPEVKIVK